MLCLIFYVPSDKFQSALCYDAIFNIHSAILVLLCVYILKCIVQYRYFRYAMFIYASSTVLLLHIKGNVQYQCLYLYYVMFNSLVLSQILGKGSPHNDWCNRHTIQQARPTRLPRGRSERATRLKQNEMRNLG